MIESGRLIRWGRRFSGYAVPPLLSALAMLTPRSRRTSPRQTIGVLLFWGVGDTVLATPCLHRLRELYPDARIIGIGRSWLAELFQGEGLFDQTIELVPPWASHRGKYRLWSPEWREFLGKIRDLRKIPFDLVLSPQPDPRDVVVSRLLRTVEVAAHTMRGGKGWVTVDLSPGVRDLYAIRRSELAALAAQALGGGLPSFNPRLKRPAPSSELMNRLLQAGYKSGAVVGLSFGASHPVRQIHGDLVSQILQGMQHRPGAFVVIGHDTAQSFAVPDGVPTVRWSGNLTELKQALATIDLLVCAESGPMHMADAVGCPVVVIFTSGSRILFEPRGSQHRVYAVEPMPCRPCFDYCLYSSPLCMDRLDAGAISALIDQALDLSVTPKHQ